MNIKERIRCCLSYKDTILKANHSRSSALKSLGKLLLILQRYYFESESQQDGVRIDKEKRCCLSYKDTILKANHSQHINPQYYKGAVAYPTKILF